MLIPVVRQTTQLQPQVLTTRDGKTIAVSAVYIYRIKDPFVAITQTLDIYVAADDIAQSALANVVTSCEAQQLYSTKHFVEIELEAVLRDKFEILGIDLDYVSIIEVGSTFVLRNIGDHTSSNPSANGAIYESF
jgi:regulator of protease activity HflC (stomatin/prohibitin superfamily)